MKRLVVLALAMAALSSCSPPPFNLEISRSAGAARLLTLEGTVGPIDKVGIDEAPQNASFLPEGTAGTTLDLQNGFMAYTHAGERRLAAIIWDTTKAMYRVMGSEVHLGSGGGTTGGGTSGDPYERNAFRVLQGSARAVGWFRFNPVSPPDNTYQELTADPATESFGPSSPLVRLDGDLLEPLYGPGSSAIGVSTYPFLPPAVDDTYWLVRLDFTDTFHETKASIATGGLGPVTSLRPGPYTDMSWLVPPLMDHVLYYYDPEPTRAPQRSFISWYDQGAQKWRCWAWEDTVVGAGAELSIVDHRIDALLTTGELLSTEGDTGRLYSRDGALLSSFDLTGLVFIDERFLGGTAKVLFSQALYADGRPSFNIYSIPTTDLKTLGP